MKKSALIIALIALSLSAANSFIIIQEHFKQDVQYVLYLGTNHKNTNEPVFSKSDAKFNADSILVKYFSGFTIQEADGGWLEDNGVISHEYTLVIYLSDTNLNQVHKACGELIEKFHQNSVLIQANTTKTEFYSGE